MDQEPISEPTDKIEDAGAAMAALMTPPEETPPPAEKPKQEEKKPDETPPAETPPAEKKPDETPPAETPPAETPPEEDHFDDEVEQISPKSKEAIRILKDKAKAEHGEVKKTRAELAEERKARAEIDARIKELETKVITPELENELNELRTFRQTYALETDPAVTQPFDDRVAAATEGITDLMKQIAVPEATQKFINDNGGLYNFRTSNGFMPSNLKNKDGSRMTHAQFYKTFIAPHLTESQAEELNDSFAEIRKANRDKANAIKQLATNKEAYLKRKKEIQDAATKEWVERVGTHSKKVLESYGDAAKMLDIPVDATPEQRAAIEQHNADYKTAEARATQIMQNVTPENLVEAAIAAGYVTVVQRQLKDAQSKISALTTERDEAKKKYQDLIEAGKTSDLAGTHELPPPGTKPAANAEEAMTNLMNQR